MHVFHGTKYRSSYGLHTAGNVVRAPSKQLCCVLPQLTSCSEITELARFLCFRGRQRGLQVTAPKRRSKYPACSRTHTPLSARDCAGAVFLEEDTTCRAREQAFQLWESRKVNGGREPQTATAVGQGLSSAERAWACLRRGCAGNELRGPVP